MALFVLLPACSSETPADHVGTLRRAETVVLNQNCGDPTTLPGQTLEQFEAACVVHMRVPVPDFNCDTGRKVEETNLTVIALLHDAILVMGAFAITYTEFSLTTLAAILTVIGYSMNDTIVVFDRIRENVARYRDKKFDRVVNASINETLSRTILVSGTVFFVTLAMNLLGTGTIRDFAFAMNVGVIVGTYSSIFIASPMLIWLNERYFKPAPQKGKAGKGRS